MQTYLVGGAVRDQLLGWSIKERDWVVVGSTPEQMVAQGYRPVGKDFPVFLHPQTQEEYALARTERKQGRGYYGFVCFAEPSVTLEDDLLRRDLTINAMAQAPDGTIIDLYQGQRDLQHKLLRHVSPAFAEDPVRLLRVARFAARYAHLGFRIAPETLTLMRTMVSMGEVDALVSERVWQEIDKALGEAQPQQFFLALRACGALAVLLPELDRLFGVPNLPQQYPEIDTGIHSLLALEQATQLSTDKRVRFAALLAQVGKGLTSAAQWPEHGDYTQFSKAIIQAIAQRYHLPKIYHELATLVACYHQAVHQLTTLTADKLLHLLERLDAFRRLERLEPLLLACQADWQGRLGYAEAAYPVSAVVLHIVAELLTVTIQPLIDQGLQGLVLGQALRQQRLLKLAQLLAR